MGGAYGASLPRPLASSTFTDIHSSSTLTVGAGRTPRVGIAGAPLPAAGGGGPPRGYAVVYSRLSKIVKSV